MTQAESATAIRVASVEAFRVRLPLVHSFQTSSHRKAYLEHILVRVTDGEGGEGWGEIASPSDPYYCPETVDTCWFMLRKYLGPALLAHTWSRPEEAAEAWRKVRGHNFAKAGLDIACWDLWSRRRSTPLSIALGGERTAIAAGVSLGIEPSIEDLVTQVNKHVAGGYRRVKLKIQPGWDVEPVRAVKRAYPHLVLQVDANGVYTESPEHLEALEALDHYGLLLIEQPFAPGALAAHARLQSRVSTPICLDESIDDVEQLDSAVQLGAGRILNIKVSRMGGLTAAKRAHDVAVAAGWEVWCGGMHEFGIGRAANVAIASLPGFTLPSDVSGSDKYYARDVIDPPVRAEDGMVAVPLTAPGLGHTIDDPFIRELATETLTL